MGIQIRYIEPLFYLSRGSRNLEKYGKIMTIKDLSELDNKYFLTFDKEARKKLELLIKILHQK